MLYKILMTIVQIFIKYNSEVLVDLKNMKSPETIAQRVKESQSMLLIELISISMYCIQHGT